MPEDSDAPADGLDSEPEAEPTITVHAQSQANRCSYCHDDFKDEHSSVQCFRCHTRLHRSCLLFSNQCPSPGCSAMRVEILREAKSEKRKKRPRYPCSRCREPRPSSLSVCSKCQWNPRHHCRRCHSQDLITIPLNQDALTEELRGQLAELAVETITILVCKRCRSGQARINES